MKVKRATNILSTVHFLLLINRKGTKKFLETIYITVNGFSNVCLNVCFHFVVGNQHNFIYKKSFKIFVYYAFLDVNQTEILNFNTIFVLCELKDLRV